MAKRVLVIEDEDFIRDLYRSELAKNGYEALAYATAEEGLTALKANKYDAVLLDIMLPGMNGLDFLKQIKEDPANKDLKVVMLTNLGQENIIKQGFEYGASGYLIKSAHNPDEIMGEVKNFIEGTPSAAKPS
jgi:DNA-binding response OmpR family regulator